MMLLKVKENCLIFVAHSYPDKDPEDFIEQYMKSKKQEKGLKKRWPMSTQ